MLAGNAGGGERVAELREGRTSRGDFCRRHDSRPVQSDRSGPGDVRTEGRLVEPRVDLIAGIRGQNTDPRNDGRVRPPVFGAYAGHGTLVPSVAEVRSYSAEGRRQAADSLDELGLLQRVVPGRGRKLVEEEAGFRTGGGLPSRAGFEVGVGETRFGLERVLGERWRGSPHRSRDEQSGDSFRCVHLRLPFYSKMREFPFMILPVRGASATARAARGRMRSPR